MKKTCLNSLFILFYCFFVNGNTLFSQKYTLYLHSDGDSFFINKNKTERFNNPAEANIRLLKLTDRLIGENYIAASLDSVIINDSLGKIDAFIHPGRKYTFDTLQIDSAGRNFLNRLDIDIPGEAYEFIRARQKILKYYGDQGHPFARVNLSGLQIREGRIDAALEIQKGPQVYIDTLIIKGDVKLRQGFIENYLDIYTGDPYNHSIVSRIEHRISNLGYIELAEAPRMSHYNNYLTIELILKERNSSRFDFIFGIIPTGDISDKSLFFSLDITAEMRNRLGYGEYIFLDFERLRPEQQKFELAFNYPYLFDLPFAVDLNFKIFRNAFDYQTLTTDLGISYLLGGRDYLKAAWNFESSRLVDIDTLGIINSQMLPQDLDFNMTGLVLEYNRERLDYRFNPRQGHWINFRGVIGRKSILKNTGILSLENESVDFSNSYDTLDTSLPRLELKLDFDFYIPLTGRSSIRTGLRSGWRHSSEGLFRNEKFQIGGNKLLRGFDEARFFTSYYAISTIAYRLLLSNNSYLSLPFWDLGIIEDAEGEVEWATGIGGGLGLETGAGLFNFSVAVGRTGSGSFDLSRPKAHIGFISLF